MFINIGIRKHSKHLTTLFFGSGTKLLFTFLSLKFFDMRREREEQFLSMLTFPSDTTRCGAPLQTPSLTSASSENQLPFSSVESLLTFFFKSQNSQPIASGHDVIHVPGPFPIWGFYCDICDCHIHLARVWTPALNVCTKLTHALSGKFLSITKPKGKIYKTINDNIKKNPSAII